LKNKIYVSISIEVSLIKRPLLNLKKKRLNTIIDYIKTITNFAVDKLIYLITILL